MSEEIKEENVTNKEVTEPDTHEYVIIDEENYKAESVTTGTDSISFALADMAIADAVTKFSDVTELDVAGADLRPYGVYRNLSFVSATVNATGLVTVRFGIASAADVRLSALAQSQEEQNVVIADILYGGEAE